MCDVLLKKTENILFDYKTIRSEIKNLKIYIEETNKSYEGCKGISYQEGVGKSNKFNSVVENEILKKEKKIEKWMSEIQDKEMMLAKIENALESLNEREHKIIELRYFRQVKKWDTIAESMDLSSSYCRNLNRSTLEKLGKIIFVGEYEEAI